MVNQIVCLIAFLECFPSCPHSIQLLILSAYCAGLLAFPIQWVALCDFIGQFRILLLLLFEQFQQIGSQVHVFQAVVGVDNIFILFSIFLFGLEISLLLKP